MRSKPQVEWITRKALYFRVFILFTLAGYSCVFLYSPGILPHSAHHHEIHIIDSCLRDPCHLSVYHPGTEGTCTHKFHFTSADGSCDWCNILLAQQLPSFAEEDLQSRVYTLKPTTHPQTRIFPQTVCFPLGRGPPEKMA